MHGITTLMAAGLLVGLAQPVAAQAGQASDTQQIGKLVQEYGQRYGSKDAAGVAALYAPDGLWVSPFGGALQGRAAIQEQAQAEMTAGNQVTSTLDRIGAVGDAGWAQGAWTGDEPGQPHRHGLWTGFFVRSGGVWRIQVLTDFSDLPQDLAATTAAR